MFEQIETLLERIGMDWDYFGPDGLGWNSPSQAAHYYSKNQVELQWDMVAVDSLKAKSRAIIKAAEEESIKAARGGAMGSSAIDPAFKALIQKIMKLSEEGYPPDVIAITLGYNEMGIRNVLRLRGRPLANDELAPEMAPEVRAFIERLRMPV